MNAAVEINVANIANVAVEVATRNHWYSPRWHEVDFTVRTLDGKASAAGRALVEVNYGPGNSVESVAIHAFTFDDEAPFAVRVAVRDALPGLLASLDL